jgi:hypothetical protein
MPTWNSGSYDGRYLQLYISETINTINNTSTLNWKLSSIGGNVNYYTIDTTTVTINGTQVYYKDRTLWDTKAFPAAKGSVSGSITVAHNPGGDKTIAIGFSTRVYYYSTIEYGGNMTLINIDRTAPTVNISTSSITATSVYVSASASTTCDLWQYSKDGGSSWTQYSTSSTTSAGTTITGLSPNTSYTILVRARKKTNRVYGTSGSRTAKTLGPAVLNSVSTVTADNATATITFNWTVYSTSFNYELAVKNGSTTITTISIPAQTSTGTSNKTVTLTTAQRSAILAAMASTPSFTGTFALTTYSGGAQIGSTSSKTATIRTTAANSAPTFSNSAGFTYQDVNAITAAITGNNQLFIQGYSSLRATAYSAIAKNGATITQYEATISGTTVTSSGTTLNIGIVNSEKNAVLTVKAIDSRGYPVQVQKTITVIAYKGIEITDITMRRMNEVEATTQVTIDADISKILVSSVNKNAFQSLKYRYKKTSDASYGSYVTITDGAVATDTNITYDNNEFVSLDPDYSYNVQFYIEDKLTSNILTVTIPQGTPLISKRRKRVGINNRNPQSALDVVGEIMMNGYNVQGVIGTIETGADFNTIKSPGIYFFTNSGSYPNKPGAAGILEVIVGGDNVIQRFTEISSGCALYVRSYIASSSTWTSWTTK